MTGEIKKTAKHTAIYAIGSILRHITGFVMLPIYTRYLIPADYGAVELLTMAIEITGILIGLRITQALFRFYILAKDEIKKKEIVSTVLLTILASSSFGALILYFSAKPLSTLIFGDSSYLYEFQLFSLTLITNAASAVGLAFLRARQMPVLFISIGAVTLALQVVLNVFFVVFLDLHVRGVVYSSLCSGMVIAIGLCWYVFRNVGVQYSYSIFQRLVRFVAPLILASIGGFYVAYADKYFLRLFGSLTDVGLYVLAARLSSIPGTLYDSFNTSWNADRYEIVKHKNASDIFNQIFRFVSVVLVLAGVGLALFAADFFHIITSPNYYPAAGVVPLLVIASLVNIYKMFCNFGIMLGEHTRHIAEATWIKVVIVTAGYLVLIPYLGIYGAAFALLISNLFEFYWVNKYARRNYDMNLRWMPINMMFIAGLICVAVGILIPTGVLSWFILRVMLYAGFVFLIFRMPVLHEVDQQILRAGLNKILSYIFRYKVVH